MFWERFYNLCLQKGTKPNPVAQEINISSGIITKWKNEGTLPSGENLVKLANYFDVSVDYLLGRTDEPAAHKKKNELIDLINQLTPEERQKLMNFYLLLKNEHTQSEQE